MKIAVAGTGYVGLSISVLLAQHNKVTAVDIIPAKVEMINNRKSPIQDDYIEKYLAEKELDLTATLDAEAAYKDADDFDSKSCRTVEQVPAHIIAALNCMIGSGFTVGYMLDFLEDNHIWLSNRVLTEYIRKRKADKCGY